MLKKLTGIFSIALVFTRMDVLPTDVAYFQQNIMTGIDSIGQ